MGAIVTERATTREFSRSAGDTKRLLDAHAAGNGGGALGYGSLPRSVGTGSDAGQQSAEAPYSVEHSACGILMVVVRPCERIWTR